MDGILFGIIQDIEEEFAIGIRDEAANEHRANHGRGIGLVIVDEEVEEIGEELLVRVGFGFFFRKQAFQDFGDSRAFAKP